MGFLDDYQQLLLKTPKVALVQWDCENSAYTLFQNFSKNCYMCRGSGWMRDCFYDYWTYHAEDAVDCSYCEKIELCYECVDCMRSYNCHFSQECRDSRDLTLCYDCVGCNNCFGCSGLVRKEYHVFNERKSKEEYEAFVEKTSRAYRETGKWPEEIVAAFEALKLKTPHRDYILNSENCLGNHIENSQNCFWVFDAVRSRDCLYGFNSYENIDCVDCSFTKTEIGYEVLGGGWNFNCDYCVFCVRCIDSQFCFQCRDCKNCFGCDGLDHKQYYILNQPYSKEAYEKRVAEIWRELKASSQAGNLMHVFDDAEFSGIEH